MSHQQYGQMQQHGPGGYMHQKPPAGQIPMMTAEEHTMMWAQSAQRTYYDSGIQSGVTTHGASSVISGTTGSLVDDYNDPYTPGYTQEQVDSYNADYEATRAVRIRNAMFPETVDEGVEMPSTQYDFGQSTNIQRLTEPSQMLKTAVVNIINYQDDAELTLKAIPELIKLLGDVDPVVVGQAANIIHSLSKREAASYALASSRPLINAVLHLMNNSNDPEITKHTVGTLYNVSRHQNGLLAIFESGGIPALVRLLASPIDSVVFYAITTLHNLIMHQQGAKEAVRRAEGVPRMVMLLKTKNLPKFLAIVVDCLYNLAVSDQETKTSILHQGGPQECVRIMRSFDYEKLLWTTARLLQALSICPHNKLAIVGAGGLQALAPHLSHPSQRLVRTILLATRNLSDAALKEENVEQLLRGLLQLIGCSDNVVVSCCVCILSNITCNNVRNKAFICRSGGVEILMRTLEMTPMNEIEIIEATLCSLRHITMRHPDADHALNAVRLYPNALQPTGLQLVSRYVQTQPPVSLICVKTALGLIRNLCTNTANLPSFYEFGVVHNVCALLIRHYQLVQQNQRIGAQPPVIENVTCMEMIENSALALHELARDVKNRAYIRQAAIIPILVQLLYFDIESIQRVAAGALSELARDPEGAQAIEQQQGAVAQLSELLHSRNEGISTYAGSILYALSRNKPEDYQKHLNVELTTSLLRDDSAPWGQDGLGEMPHMQDDAFGDIVYPGGGYDPSVNFDQMHMNSPAPVNVLGYDAMDTSGHLPPQYGGPPSNQPAARQQRPNPQGGAMHDWYDTDL